MSLDTGKILVAAYSVFRLDCRDFFEQQFAQADYLCGELRISFRSESRFSEDIVQLKIRIGDQHKVVWISDLRVAPEFRCQGRGRRLVTTTETIARILGFQRIHLFPLWSARPFWEKMGYRPLVGSARIMAKDVLDGLQLKSKTLANPEAVTSK